jgi:hypothetical protein
MERNSFLFVCILALMSVSCDLRPLPDYESVLRFSNAVLENKTDLAEQYIKKYKDICMFSLSSPGGYEVGMVGMAVASGNIEMVKLMVKHKASVNVVNQPGGFTALETAVAVKNLEMIKYLLDNGADPKNIDAYGNNIFHTLALEFRNIDAAVLIGENISDLPNYINMKNNEGYTPLTLLIFQQIKENVLYDDEELKMLEFYLACGADTSSVIGSFPGNDLYTILIQRKVNDYLKILFSNTNKKLPNVFGTMNYVMISIYFNNIEMVPIFIPLVKNINERDEYGQTALHRAAYQNDENLFKILLENGIDKNIKDSDGYTAYDTYIKNHESYNKNIIDLIK